MTTLTSAIRKSQSLAWWQWIELLGAISFVVLLIAFVCGVKVPSFVIGLILHIAMDFTFQSSETAGRKGERGRHLAVHALIAGGLVGLLTGLSVSLWAGIGGLIIGGLSHYGIDYSRKFGLANWKLGLALDQVLHLGAIAIITSL